MHAFSSQPRTGWIEVITGPMFSGKSEELIRRVRRALIADTPVRAFNSALDDRYDGPAVISSHDRRTVEARPVEKATDILEALETPDGVIAIDEAQFFDDMLVEVADVLADAGCRVILAGTSIDAEGRPFGPMGPLLAVADRVDVLTAVCVRCGGPATRNQRLLDGEPAPFQEFEIQVGGAGDYEARCRACHEVPGRERSVSLPGQDGASA